MDTPAYDMRRLKLTPEGYTMELQGNRSAPLLCDQCGAAPVCNIRKKLDRIAKRYETEARVMICRHFVPVVTFNQLKGLDLPIFNTIRLGRAWYERVKFPQPVLVFDTVNGKPLGRRFVAARFVGSMKDMLALHAVNNHMLKGTKVEDPAAEMFKILRRAYGTTFTTWERDVSVLYLDNGASPNPLITVDDGSQT